MRASSWLAAITGSSLVLAGCLTEPYQQGDDTPAPAAPYVGVPIPPDLVHPFLVGHDHANAALHNYAYDVKELYHHPLGGSLAKSSGAHAVDVQAGFLFVATYGAQADVDGGVWIFDLKDPAKPALVGQVRLPGNLGGDRSMEVTDDGNWMLLGTEAIDCAGHINPFGPGLYLIDARDKARPIIADYLPDDGVHSVTIHRINGQDYGFALMGGQNIVRIDKGGPRATLVRVGTVSIGHDSAAYDDPVLGVPVLYSATGGPRLLVHNISDPAKPTVLGNWTLPTEEAREKSHYVHAVAMQMVEGRRLLALESEDWQKHPSPVWMLDATDFTDIERLSAWTNPGNVPASANQTGTFGGQLTFSTHNPRLEDGLLYMAHYHGGVWILNVSTLAQAAQPEILGYYLPHNNNGGFVPRSGEGAYAKPNICGFTLAEVPIVFDVEVQDGYVYAADLHTGLYVMKHDPSVGQVKPS